MLTYINFAANWKRVEGVTLVHDIHVWTLSAGNEALTAHILIDPDYTGDADDLRLRLRDIIYNDFGIGPHNPAGGKIIGRLL